MFNTTAETLEVAQVLATAQCMLDRGKLVYLPPAKDDAHGQAVWSGLITRVTGATTFHNTEYTLVLYITGDVIETSLSVRETMELLGSP